MNQKTVTITKLAYGGEGVGRLDGKVVFVSGTVPGDKVTLKNKVEHGRFDRAEVESLVSPSPHRVSPPCTHFPECGGCQWQQMDYETQASAKESIVRETLGRVGGIQAPPIHSILKAKHPWHYRRRIQLKVDAHHIGYYAFKSHRIVPIQECLIADKRLNEALQKVVSEGKQKKNFELTLPASKTQKVEITDAEEEGRVFLQVNEEQNEALVKTVLHFAFGQSHRAFTQKLNLVDLYAGTGNFTFPLAEKAGQVIAVEENVASLHEGERLAEQKGVENIEWVKGTAEWGLKKLYRRRMSVDVLVLDPPRRGASEIIDLLAMLRPRLLVYVSCDPTTLARDLKQLVRRHYQLKAVQPIDMFPQTYHIESVAQLVLVP